MLDEKHGVMHVESNKLRKGSVHGGDDELAIAVRNYVPDTPEEKKLVRKIDLRLMPTLWVMYILNYVDRTNIGNAKIAGMSKDLKLDDQGYAWILSIFFIGYLIMEVPSNMILSRSRPSLFLPGIMLVWGALSAAMASAKSYGAMLAFRFILGCIESGFFPGVLFLMSCWYKPAEIGKRFGIFYSAAVISGALGGIMAGAITGGLHDAHGITGWRWLFIVEGVATIGVAIIASFILLDFPSTSKGLSHEERQLAVVRLVAGGQSSDAMDAENRLTHWQAFKAAVTDYRVWIFVVMYVLDVGAGTISYFIPTLALTLGYSTVTAQYMTIPIYMVAAVILNIVAWSSDRTGDRRWHICAVTGFGCISAIVLAATQQPVARYVFLCFTAAGIWSAIPQILAWAAATINLPAEKRAIALAMVNAIGNLSSVYGSQLWPKRTAPKYTIGFAVTASFLGCASLLAALIPVLLHTFRPFVTTAERQLREKQELAKEHARQAEENQGV